MNSNKQYNLKKIQKLSTFDDDLSAKLKNPEFKKRHYIALKRLELAHEIMLARKKAKMTQIELAKKLKTSQSFIARVENGNQNLTIDGLIRITNALSTKQKKPVKFQIPC